MRILLEGPDCAGKTTLAREIVSYAGGGEVWHKGSIKSDVLTEYFAPLRDSLPRDVVLDRWHVGELIYGPLLRGESKLDMAQFTYMEMLLERLGFLTVYVDTPLYEVALRHLKRGDELIDGDRIDRVWSEYRRLLRNRAGWLELEYQREELLRTSHEAWQQWVGFPWDNYIGARWPRVLLLGDRPHRDDTTWPWPFVPASATSGHFLMKALNLVGAPVRTWGLTNACNRSPDDLRALYAALARPTVVALGVNATRAAQEAGLKVKRVNHPQYMRRFYHSQVQHYGEEILSAAAR